MTPAFMFWSEVSIAAAMGSLFFGDEVSLASDEAVFDRWNFCMLATARHTAAQKLRRNCMRSRHPGKLRLCNSILDRHD